MKNHLAQHDSLLASIAFLSIPFRQIKSSHYECGTTRSCSYSNIYIVLYLILAIIH